MRYLIVLLLAGCSAVATPPAQPVYVTRTVKDCSWIPVLSASSKDTPDTKREIIAYETARQANCPAKAAAPAR